MGSPSLQAFPLRYHWKRDLSRLFPWLPKISNVFPPLFVRIMATNETMKPGKYIAVRTSVWCIRNRHAVSLVCRRASLLSLSLTTNDSTLLQKVAEDVAATAQLKKTIEQLHRQNATLIEDNAALAENAEERLKFFNEKTAKLQEKNDEIIQKTTENNALQRQIDELQRELIEVKEEKNKTAKSFRETPAVL